MITGSKDLTYAIGSLIVEMSNESGTNVNDPGVVGAFYRSVMSKSEGRQQSTLSAVQCGDQSRVEGQIWCPLVDSNY